MFKMLATIFILLISTRLFAPGEECIFIERTEGINPYTRIWDAICQIESNKNPLAYHMEDNGHPSIGIAQIQESRLNDFKRRTGINYTLMDMYSPEKAKVVFMAYCSEISHNDIERISREWNGGNKGMEKESTIKYWKKVQRAIN